MDTPTLTAYADRLIFLAPTTDETADAGRAVVRSIEAAGGFTWASFGTNQVRVYDLSHLAGDPEQWNGVVQALSDELFALRHGQAVVYSKHAMPVRTVATFDVVDHDTYDAPGGFLAVFYDGPTRGRVKVAMTRETAEALVEELSDGLNRGAVDAIPIDRHVAPRGSDFPLVPVTPILVDADPLGSGHSPMREPAMLSGADVGSAEETSTHLIRGSASLRAELRARL